MENAARLCNLDTLSIALSKLHGLLLKSASYLESKETNSGKTLVWSSLKKHLTSNYSKILYDTHAINAHDSLQQGSNESTKAYLHRAQDILECIHHTSDMSSITAIGTNHAKILTGLNNSRLAELKAKNWITMAQVLQDVVDMVVDFKRSHGYSLPMFNVFHTRILVPLTGPTSHLQKAYNNCQHDQINPNVGIAMEITSKRTVPQPLNMVPRSTKQRRKSSTI